MDVEQKIRLAADGILKEIEYKTRKLEDLSCATHILIEEAKKEIEEEYVKSKKEIEEEYVKFQESKKEIEEGLERRENFIREVIESKQIFRLSAKMYADVKMRLFEEYENYLRCKPHPSLKGADTVKLLKREAEKHCKRYREMEYKYNILLGTFPELRPYIDDTTGEALVSLKETTLGEISANYDKRRDYLSLEEWSRLTESERSQLSLDRYNKRDKSNWVIGNEYEMYIEYLLRQEGYNTIPHGSIQKLSDLGRDIIATKVIEGKLQTYIIQCKRYGAGKEIHENTICQLYGTTIEYELSNQSFFDDIIPCLYTTVSLSDMAKKFAERLGVKVTFCKMGEYPQIKCNISSNGEKIYHLPFDQQYYSTKIDKEGEFYAWNVAEAERAGFRRARKYIQ